MVLSSFLLFVFFSGFYTVKNRTVLRAPATPGPAAGATGPPRGAACAGRARRCRERGAESAAANAQAEAAAGPGRGWSRGRAGGAAAAAAMGLLNFTREPVPEAVSADMHNLNQLSAQVRRNGDGRGGRRGQPRTRNRRGGTGSRTRNRELDPARELGPAGSAAPERSRVWRSRGPSGRVPAGPGARWYSPDPAR